MRGQAGTHVNGKHSPETVMDEEMWKSQADKREQEIDRITTEKLELQKQLDELEIQVCILSEHSIISPLYIGMFIDFEQIRRPHTRPSRLHIPDGADIAVERTRGTRGAGPR